MDIMSIVSSILVAFVLFIAWKLLSKEKLMLGGLTLISPLLLFIVATKFGLLTEMVMYSKFSGVVSLYALIGFACFLVGFCVSAGRWNTPEVPPT